MAEGPDPTRRFYVDAGTEPGEGGWLVLLDGRPVRTPGKARLALPTEAAADAVAAEWRAQGETVDPRTMPLTRLANSAVDGVAAELDAVRADIARYAGSDLVLYRAEGPDRLVQDQAQAWDPVLAFAREALGARFVVTEGVMPVEQPRAAIDRVAERLSRETSPFGLAALHVMTTLTGSVLLALMHAAGRLDVEAAWRAAHVDELFQESRWGLDLEASRRREAREAEFRAASRLRALLEP